MPLISFSVFKEKVQNGTKRQTIRELRKYPIKIDDRLYLWWKSRTPQREKLGESNCTEVFSIQIHSQYWLGKQRPLLFKFVSTENLTWVTIQSDEVLEIAKRDGFNGEDDFLAFFSKRPLPIVCQVIRWSELVTSKVSEKT